MENIIVHVCKNFVNEIGLIKSVFIEQRTFKVKIY
jgi:hypothetical protein